VVLMLLLASSEKIQAREEILYIIQLDTFSWIYRIDFWSSKTME